MTVRLITVFLIHILFVHGITWVAFAGPAADTPQAPQRAPDAGSNSRTQHAPPAVAPAPQIPDGTALSILIRRTLLTLNDANLTGNYTVVRDQAAPGFGTANNAAKLAEIFANLRQKNVDLAPVMNFDPKLVRQPQITPNGMLRLSGFMPTAPQQVNFDMLFQKLSGRWRLFGLAVNTSTAQPPAASLGAAGSQAAKKKKQKQ